MRISYWSSDVCSSDLHASPLPDANGRRKKVTGHPPAAWSRVMPRLQGWFLQQPHDALAWPEPRETPRGEWGWTVSHRSEEHTSELQSLMRISYAVFCLKKKKKEY